MFITSLTPPFDEAPFTWGSPHTCSSCSRSSSCAHHVLVSNSQSPPVLCRVTPQGPPAFVICRALPSATVSRAPPSAALTGRNFVTAVLQIPPAYVTGLTTATSIAPFRLWFLLFPSVMPPPCYESLICLPTVMDPPPLFLASRVPATSTGVSACMSAVFAFPCPSTIGNSMWVTCQPLLQL